MWDIPALNPTTPTFPAFTAVKLQDIELLDIAIRAAIDAGTVIMHVYDTAFKVDVKSDHSPLTKADRDAHKVIAEQLQQTELPVLREEGRDIAYDERKNWEKFWMVDPLDGTKEFVKRNGEFTVNIALIENGKPIAGVIFVPVTKILYVGWVGESAWKFKLSDRSAPYYLARPYYGRR